MILIVKVRSRLTTNFGAVTQKMQEGGNKVQANHAETQIELPIGRAHYCKIPSKNLKRS